MNLPYDRRKLLIVLEPCSGVVYLFVRKTRPCWPNPYSCVDLLNDGQQQSSNSGNANPDDSFTPCDWTHYSSVIDGSMDGAPTVLELPLSSTQWYISVYAKQSAQYTLTVLTDIGQWPRPGQLGNMTGTQVQDLTVELQWRSASFFPSSSAASVKRYWVYSSILLETEQRKNPHVFLSPRRIMNTVCGLSNNTDQPFAIADANSICSGGDAENGMICKLNVSGIMTNRRYLFNVVAESNAGFMSAYSGLLMATSWQAYTLATSDTVLNVMAAVTGSVMGIVVIAYVWLVRVYT